MLVLSTILRWGLDDVVERLENVEDDESKVRMLFYETGGGGVQLLVEGLGVGVDARDAAFLMISK